MHQKLEFKIEGISPLIMHNGRILTNPLNSLTKCIKTFSGKRSKTEDDHLAMSKLEWIGGLYLSSEPVLDVQGSQINASCDGDIIIPGEVLEALLREGAKKSKLGTAFKAGIVVLDDYNLEHEGNGNLEEMWESGNFADMRNVKIQRAAIIRTRPIFRKWSLSFDVHYLPSVVDPDQIHEALTIAGQIVGLCDYRPKHGRFVIAD